MSNERKLYLRIYLSMLVGMFIALVLIRLFAFAMDASGSTFLGRVLEARAALPQITQEQEDLVMVFGSSMVHAGFSARHFDREVNAMGGEVKSWNFGFGGLNPYFQDYLSRRIREGFEQDERRLRLALIEFNPFQTTQTRWQGAVPAVDSFITMLASDDELWQMALEDPERGALLFNIKYLRDNVSAEMATTFFGRMFREPPQLSDRPGLDEEQQARFDEISDELNSRFEEEYPDFVPAQWKYDWQGAGTVPWERPAETVAMFPEFYALQHNEERMHNDLLFRIRSADAVDLNFEDLLVERFIAVVENFKPIADEVEVILLPRNTDWINYTPEVAARLQSVIERIERETGVPVRNQQLIEASPPEAFSDTTHLGRYVGDIPWTEHLVREYGERLVD
jgi:hypothetical protein